MALEQVAPGVERLGQFPLPMVNVYLAGDVLFDAGMTWDRFRIPRRIDGYGLLTPPSRRSR